MVRQADIFSEAYTCRYVNCVIHLKEVNVITFYDPIFVRSVNGKLV